ncbi:MAG TPA: LPS export ABC transporter periplasmic protein LptC [Candidatus Edwardsbacteria bacterium]|nr:LPS export ABC transporter periplasmic protein LptC [Candidatus Edwardsbacteria bacterium]
MFKRSHILLAATIGLAAVGLMGCGGGARRAIPQAASKLLPSQSIDGFKLIETIMGKRAWILNADSANTYDQTQTVELFKLKVDFYKKSGDTVMAVLNSERGTINTQTRDVEAREHVVVVTRDSLKIYTDYIQWINKARRLVTQSHVRLEKGTDWLVGDGMIASPDGREVQLLHNVKGKKELLNFEGYTWQ